MDLDDGTVSLPDGRRIGYAEYGDRAGWPILHFHGLPGSRAYTLDGDALRTAGARLITVERPGIGMSDPQPGRALDHWPRDVADFADGLGLGRFAVLGTSAGAPYAFTVAGALGDRVTALGLQCGLGPAFSHPEFDDRLGPAVAAMLPIARRDRDGVRPLVREVLNGQRDEWHADPDGFWSRFVAGWPEADRGGFERDKDLWWVNLTATYARRDEFADDVVNAFGPWNVDPGDLTLPVRAWHGDCDEAAPLELIRIPVEAAGGTVVVYAGEGHYIDRSHNLDMASWLVQR